MMQQHLAPELLTPRRTAARGDAAVNTATLTYSTDGKYLFQREAHVIRVLNTKNGQLLHECIRSEAQPLGVIAGEAKTKNESDSASAAVNGDRQQVTALALHPHNALQLIAAYEDGKVLVWDFSEEKILQEFNAKASILWMESSTVSPSMLMMVVTPEDSTVAASKWSLIEFNMKKKRRGRTLLEQSKLAFKSASMQSYKDSDEAAVTTSDERFHGDYVVIVAGARMFGVRVQREQDGSVGMGRPFTTQKYTHLRDVTCVAVHPSAAEFVIGDSLGQLYRHHGQGAATTSKMHWHAHAVKCVAYSSDGNFLVSGGEECVFVSWHIESGRRSYLPRRSAPLSAIATRADGAGYAIALEDHVLFQYNHITKEEEWHALGLARSGETAEVTLPSRQLVFDPISHAIPLNGRSSAGVLQFYEPYKDRVLQSVLLTERNQVTRTEDEEIPQILAEQLQFSPSGSELVTLHSNVLSQDETKKKGDEQSLRFWKRRENGSFFVSTAIDAPHGRESVTCLAFSPSPYNESVVTGDSRGEFKVWKKNEETLSWYCQSVVQFRDEPITAVAFADDGSLVAVAYNHLLTLWDVGTNALRHVISSADGNAIRQVAFTGATSPYVVLKTETQVQVWNLLSFELWWRYEVPEESFVSTNTQREQFVVWFRYDEQQHLVLVFQSETPVPVKVQAVNVGESGIWSVRFHPKNGDLLVLDGDSNVWRIGDSALDKNRRKDVATADEVNVLDAMFKRASHGAAKFQQNVSKTRQLAVNGNAANALFDAPAHVLPSMTALYRSFMDTMLPKPNAQVVDGAGADEDDNSANPQSKRQKKKSNKKRKKLANASTDGDNFVATDENKDDDKQKRMKLLVEKELANPALQQQTYSKLLAAFRKTKQ
ncbi:Wd40 repeat-like protein, partial [Globisporangium splendens]